MLWSPRGRHWAASQGRASVCYEPASYVLSNARLVSSGDGTRRLLLARDLLCLQLSICRRPQQSHLPHTHNVLRGARVEGGAHGGAIELGGYHPNSNNRLLFRYTTVCNSEGWLQPGADCR